MKTIKLTKMSGEKSTSTALEDGQSVEGVIVDGSMFPDKPTVGRPFVIDTYRTSEVQRIINDEIFETHNSRYHWKEITSAVNAKNNGE